jgi:ribosomal-protein-alanine N-acetyltransferase
MSEWLSKVDATEAFLEVAADNDAARHLYNAYGFAEVARRKSYYARKGSNSVDAIVMRKTFT